MAKHLHLDVTGGIAGDMFLSAMLSACPELRGAMLDDLRAAGVLEHVTLSIDTVREKGFAAVRVKVTTASDAPPTSQWRDIRAFIDGSGLDAPVKARALAIFALLAEAEATCHGVAPDDVHFHEIADWDALMDVTAAGSICAALSGATVSLAALPLGGGLVETAHGKLPVPAPATLAVVTVPGPMNAAATSRPGPNRLSHCRIDVSPQCRPRRSRPFIRASHTRQTMRALHRITEGRVSWRPAHAYDARRHPYAHKGFP